MRILSPNSDVCKSRALYSLHMTEKEVAGTNFLIKAGLLPPKHGSSEVWQYFGFRGKDGKIEDPKHVSTKSACHAVLATGTDK